MAAVLTFYNEGYAKMLTKFSQLVLGGSTYDAAADRAIGLMLTLGRRVWVVVYEDGQSVEIVGDIYNVLDTIKASGKVVDEFRTDQAMRVPRITGMGILIDVPQLTITQQPQAASVTEPTAAVFTVTATGLGALSYQWQEDTGSGFADMVGETAATLTVDPTSVSMSGYQYRVVVTDDATSVTSDAAALTVSPAP